MTAHDDTGAGLECASWTAAFGCARFRASDSVWEELKGVHRVLFYSQEIREAFETPEEYKAVKALVGGEK